MFAVSQAINEPDSLFFNGVRDLLQSTLSRRISIASDSVSQAEIARSPTIKHDRVASQVELTLNPTSEEAKR